MFLLPLHQMDPTPGGIISGWFLRFVVSARKHGSGGAPPTVADETACFDLAEEDFGARCTSPAPSSGTALDAGERDPARAAHRSPRSRSPTGCQADAVGTPPAQSSPRPRGRSRPGRTRSTIRPVPGAAPRRRRGGLTPDQDAAHENSVPESGRLGHRCCFGLHRGACQLTPHLARR